MRVTASTCVAVPARLREKVAEHDMSAAMTLIEIDRALECDFGSDPVPVKPEVDPPHRNLGFGKLQIRTYCAIGRVPRRLAHL